jgi:hypothetical protein
MLIRQAIELPPDLAVPQRIILSNGKVNTFNLAENLQSFGES